MESVACSSCLLVEKKIWFITDQKKLMNFDLESKELKLVEPIWVNDTVPFKNVIDGLIFCEGNIYWVEQEGKRLLKYNTISNEVISFAMPTIKYHEWTCCSGFFLLDKIIYIIPRYTADVVLFDLNEQEFIVLKDFFSGLVINNEEKIVNKAFMYENLLIVCGIKKMMAYKVDGVNLEEKWSMVLNAEVTDFLYDGISVWLLCNDGFVKSYSEGEEKFNFKIDDNCSLLVDANEKIIALPGTGNTIYIFNKNTYLVESISALPHDNNCACPIDYSKYITYCVSGDYILIPLRTTRYILVIDKGNNSCQWIRLSDVSFEVQKKLFLYTYKSENVFRENYKSDIELFLEYISHTEVFYGK